MKKIFILGSERSGSNLLRTLLGNHSQISAPIAPHLIDTFKDKLELYLPFNHKNLENIYEDIEAYLNHEFNDWKITLDKEKVIREYKPQSFIEVYNSVFAEKALSEGKSAYFSKDNHLHQSALGINMKLSDAYFIHLYRDPRDQVASWMRTPVHLHTPYQALNKWINEQDEILKLTDLFGLPVWSIKYEELISNPEEIMTNTLKYLGLPVENGCFQTRAENKEASKHPLWKNINQPIISKNQEKYHDVLNHDNIVMIESLGSNLMKRFKYDRTTSGAWSYPKFFAFSEKMKTKKSIKKSKNFLAGEMKILISKLEFKEKIFANRSKGN